MATIRLAMEKYVDKNYGGRAYSVIGHHAKWVRWVPKNPMYEISTPEKDPPKILLVGCDNTQTIVKMCRTSYAKLTEFERRHNKRFLLLKSDRGGIVCCNTERPEETYPLDQLVADGNMVEHIDGDLLNNMWHNLRVPSTDVEAAYTEASLEL